MSVLKFFVFFFRCLPCVVQSTRWIHQRRMSMQSRLEGKRMQFEAWRMRGSRLQWTRAVCKWKMRLRRRLQGKVLWGSRLPTSNLLWTRVLSGWSLLLQEGLERHRLCDNGQRSPAVSSWLLRTWLFWPWNADLHVWGKMVRRRLLEGWVLLGIKWGF